MVVSVRRRTQLVGLGVLVARSRRFPKSLRPIKETQGDDLAHRRRSDIGAVVGCCGSSPSAT